MAFSADELFVGMIAWLRVCDLQWSAHIAFRGKKTFDRKVRPFICYGESEGQWYWTSLTTKWNPRRHTIERRHWVYPPFQRGWVSARREGDLIVSDARSGYVGPGHAFARCSQRRDHYEGLVRPVLLIEGVEQLCAVIRKCGGPVPRSVVRECGERQAA